MLDIKFDSYKPPFIQERGSKNRYKIYKNDERIGDSY